MTTIAEHYTQSEAPSAWVKIGYGLLILPLIAILAFILLQPIQVLPRIELAPGYSLIDQHGARFTNEDVRGKFVLYTLTHSRCDDGCADTTPSMAEIANLVEGLELGGIDAAFVSISIDPAHDTPARLSHYANEVGADGERWRFVTGDPVQLKQIIGAGFNTFYHVPAGLLDPGDISFDPVYILVDGWGIKRAVYRTALPDLDIVRRDFTLLAREVQNSAGVNRFAYEAAHLFLCFPS